MALGRVVRAVFLTFASLACAQGQSFLPIPTPLSPPSETISLIAPKGTLVQLILDQEVRVQKVGQSIHGRVVLPVYAFDREVIPAGTGVTGRIIKIESISGKKRTLAILDADFTPARKIQVEFSEFVLADGRHIPLHAEITAASGQVIQFVAADENDQEKKKGIKDAASEKVNEAKEEVKRDWEIAKKQVHEPGKMHRLKRFVQGQLPVRPQYIDAGTLYFAELLDSIDFGSEQLSLEDVSFVGISHSFPKAT